MCSIALHVILNNGTRLRAIDARQIYKPPKDTPRIALAVAFCFMRRTSSVSCRISSACARFRLSVHGFVRFLRDFVGFLCSFVGFLRDFVNFLRGLVGLGTVSSVSFAISSACARFRLFPM